MTIPLAIRRKAGLWLNTEVSFTMSRGAVLLRKITTGETRGRQLVEHMRGKASTRMRTDPIMTLTRRR